MSMRYAEGRKKKARSTVHEKSHVFTYIPAPPYPLLSPHSGFVSSQSQPHPHRGSVRVHHTVVVHTAVVAQPDGSVVRLVHTKEDIDRVWREGGGGGAEGGEGRQALHSQQIHF